ncbi:hypothetical protein [Soonwooa sp.]|uniref:hypothetical protein n=1 Tax=Soonwooa sp. TaxID=1938592 RepID=UPI00261020B9|nr:hypothetical protein [Soonwooa sp.]
MKIFFSILFTIIFSVAEAQEVYEIDQVTHLELGRGNMFPARKDGDLYTKRYIFKTKPLEIIESTHHETPAYLESVDTKLISIDEVQQLSKDEIINKLKDKEWLIGKTTKDNVEYLQTIQMITPNYWLKRVYGFNTNNSFLPENKARWNIVSAYLLPMAFVKLPNNRIYVQGIHNNSSYIIPQNNGFTVGFSSDSGDGGRSPIIEALDYDKYNIDKELSTYQSSSDRNYKIIKLSDGKFQLVDFWDEAFSDGPFSKTYDEIVKNSYFVVLKNNGLYDVYNTLQQPVIKGIRDYNFDGFYIQVLQNNRLEKLGAVGKIQQEFPSNFGWCGTVPTFLYEIKANKNKTFTIVAKSGYNLSPNSKGQSFLMKSTIPIDELKWIDGSQRMSYSNRGRSISDISLNRNLLLVKSYNKFGIALAEYGTTPTLRLLTDIIYDKVEFASYDEPLILIKNNQKAVFYMPSDKNIISDFYKEVGERNKFFMRYTRENGKQGWLNLITGQSLDDE